MEPGEEAQFEGMVVDPFAGVLYAGQVSCSVREGLNRELDAAFLTSDKFDVG